MTTKNRDKIGSRTALFVGLPLVFSLYPLLSGIGRKHHGDILWEAAKPAETGKLKVLLDHRHFNLK